MINKTLLNDPTARNGVKTTSTRLQTQVSSSRITCNSQYLSTSHTMPTTVHVDNQLHPNRYDLSPMRIVCQHVIAFENQLPDPPTNQPTTEAPKYQRHFKHDRGWFQQRLPLMHTYGHRIFSFSPASISLPSLPSLNTHIEGRPNHSEPITGISYLSPIETKQAGETHEW